MANVCPRPETPELPAGNNALERRPNGIQNRNEEVRTWKGSRKQSDIGADAGGKPLSVKTATSPALSSQKVASDNYTETSANEKLIVCISDEEMARLDSVIETHRL